MKRSEKIPRRSGFLSRRVARGLLSLVENLCEECLPIYEKTMRQVVDLVSGWTEEQIEGWMEQQFRFLANDYNSAIVAGMHAYLEDIDPNLAARFMLKFLDPKIADDPDLNQLSHFAGLVYWIALEAYDISPTAADCIYLTHYQNDLMDSVWAKFDQEIQNNR